MIALNEIAKINSLIASCNDIIDGKFILANYKITNILKNISASQEVYNLLASYLNNFDFEREFSRAQLRSATETSKLVLPKEKEKLLPFVFCLLFNLDNGNINIDMFISEFYKNKLGHNEEFKDFARAVILPFRDAIAQHFEISVDKTMPLKSEKQEEEMEQKEYDEEFEEELEEDFDDDEMDYPEITAEKVEQFLLEVKAVCKEILTEIGYDRKLKDDLKDDIEYITNAIISNCENSDLQNTMALITAFDYVSNKAKSLKFLTRELKKLLYNFYD